MQIVLYQGFSKKQNSTKQPPANTTSLTLTGTLKEPCSAMNPVFRIERLQNDASPTFYSYAYIDDLDRYYFVNDWKWVRGFWEASLTVDVLASHRTAIGEQNMYVLRTNSTTVGVFNPWISDTMYPATAYATKQSTPFPNDPFAAAYVQGVAAGCYIVGILSGDDSQAVGAVTYYAFTSSQFGDLKNILFSDNNLVAMGILESDGQGHLVPVVDDMSAEILKTMYNPYQYIASCMWFPFSVSDIPNKSSQLARIDIGWWKYSVSCYRISAQIKITGQHTSVPSHPMAATRGYYMNYAPYTRRMFVGRFGIVPIDCSFIGANDNIHVSYTIDLINGNCRADISVYDNTQQEATLIRIGQHEFLMGVPIQLAQVGVDYLGTAVTAIDATAKTAGNVLSLNFTGAVSSAAHGIYDTLNAQMPQVQTSGSNGSFLTAHNGCSIISEFYYPVDEDIDHKGRPVCANKTINTLSGYVQCADGDFDINCLAEEREQISNYLTSGFFWE